jgi:hypothetical protein
MDACRIVEVIYTYGNLVITGYETMRLYINHFYGAISVLITGITGAITVIINGGSSSKPCLTGAFFSFGSMSGFGVPYDFPQVLGIWYWFRWFGTMV